MKIWQSLKSLFGVKADPLIEYTNTIHANDRDLAHPDVVATFNRLSADDPVFEKRAKTLNTLFRLREKVTPA